MKYKKLLLIPAKAGIHGNAVCKNGLDVDSGLRRHEEKKKGKNSLGFLLPFVLASCAMLGEKESLVQQIGKDSYTVRALSTKSLSEAKQKALSQANAYCKAQANRNVMLVKEDSGTEEGTGEKYDDLTFLCLTNGDSDFQRVKKADVSPEAGDLPFPEFLKETTKTNE